MSTTKHTPGPWEASADCMEISPSSGPKSHVELARIVGPGEGSSYYSYDEATANARLIAAAPELLAACKAAVNALRSCQWGNCSPRQVKSIANAAEAAEAAISKAEGR